jgi:hypothetical protein
MAKMTTGGAMWATGIYLANSGHIIGTLHPDPVIQKQIEDVTGQKHNSWVIQNDDGTRTYIPLAQIADPVGPILAAAADIAKASHYLSDGDLTSFAVAGSLAVGHSMADKNYLRGLTNFLDAATGIMSEGSASDARAQDRWKKYAAQQLGSYAVPSMLANKRGDDPYMREIRGYLDGALRKLPGSVGVDPVRNVLGEPVNSSSAVGPKDLSPWQKSTDTTDPVTQELGRQMGMGDKPLPKMPRTLTLANGKSVDLTTFKGDNGFTAYDRLQSLLAEPPGGKPSLRDTLTNLINSDRYQNGSDGQGQYEGDRLFMIHKVIGEYHQIAQKSLLAESAQNPSSPLGQIVTSAKADAENRAAALRGQPVPHPELIKKNAFKDAILAPGQ